jgi:hypothetical protein
MSFRKALALPARTAAWLFFAIWPVGAQTTIHGSLQGRVLDPTSAAVSGATVTLTNSETNAKLLTRSDEVGQYTFSRVAPGTYNLSVEKGGFRRAISANVIITVNNAATANVQLSLGTVSEVVKVEAASSIVQSQSVEISNIVDERRVRDLPLNGKNFQRLMLLAPGVGGGSATNPSVSGARPFTNSYTLDGATTNDERAQTGLSVGGGGAAGFTTASPNLISTEAIGEFNVITSNADATFGRGSGGQINIVTKSGTNNLHGSTYYFGRNNALDARDFFNRGPFFNQQGQPVVPPFHQHLYGGSIGGPIHKDRHFYFGNFEGFRQKLEQTSSATVPNAVLISLIPGDLQQLYRMFYIDRGVIPAQGNPPGGFAPLPPATRTAAIAAGFPANAINQAGTILLSTTNTRDVSQDSFLIRTDHKFGERWSVALRYGFAQPTFTSNTRAIAGVVTENRRRWQSAAAQAVYLFSQAQTLEFRASLLRSRMRDSPRDGVDPMFVKFGVNPLLGLTSIVNGTALSFLQVPGGAGFLDNQSIPQASLLHSWVKGRWVLRSGLDVRRLILNNLLISNAPFYQFNGFVGPNGLLGASPSQPQAVMLEASGTIYGQPQGPTTPQRGWRSTVQEYFVQTDWRVKQNLTMNLGLRYSVFGSFSEVNGALANLYAVDPQGNIVPDASPFQFGRFANQIAPVAGGRPFIQTDRTNFQPRLGVAWTIDGRATTVLRAGYGLFFDRPFQGLWEFGVLNFPFATSAVFRDLPFRNAGELPVAGQPTQGRFVDPTLRNPRTHRFIAALERRLQSNTSITVAYVGARSDRLWRFLEPNGQGAVPQKRRPDPRFSRYRYAASVSTSEYDSLQVYARHRYSHGLDFTVSYTYSRSRDDWSSDVQSPSLINLGATGAPGFQGGAPGQWVDRPREADWGPSDFDVTHSLSLSHIYELPFFKRNRLLGGFSINGVLAIQSGDPFSPLVGRDFESIGFSGSGRPALVPGATLDDLYAGSGVDKRQYLVPKTRADQLLGVPGPVTNPFLQVGRNSLRTCRIWFYDLSLTKQFPIRENFSAKLEVNAFNVFNHANFAAPVAILSDTRFGLVTSSAQGTNPRQLQIGLKLLF